MRFSPAMPLSDLRSILAELLTPSARDERPYLTLLIAIGHAVAGAALPVWGAGPAAALRLGLVYWLAKERADLRKGGQWRDGLIDTAFVAFGAFYGAPWWPLAIITAAVLAAILTRKGTANVQG